MRARLLAVVVVALLSGCAAAQSAWYGCEPDPYTAWHGFEADKVCADLAMAQWRQQHAAR
jgi:hypothetical protein